jgi:IS30 family transposase
MGRQGRHLREDELRRIESLLSSTDMTVRQIAERMQCSHSAITAINRKSKIRNYAGRRTAWVEPKVEQL